MPRDSVHLNKKHTEVHHNRTGQSAILTRTQETVSKEVSWVWGWWSPAHIVPADARIPAEHLFHNEHL